MKTSMDVAQQMGMLDGLDANGMVRLLQFAHAVEQLERDQIAQWLERSCDLLEQRSNENEHMGKSITPTIQTILNTQRDIARWLRDGEVS